MENKDYTENDLEDSLKRAFVDARADYIILDTRRNKFLIDGIQYGLDKGWLYKGEDIDEDKILGPGLGQYFAHTFRLTDNGKEYFGLNN